MPSDDRARKRKSSETCEVDFRGWLPLAHASESTFAKLNRSGRDFEFLGKLWRKGESGFFDELSEWIVQGRDVDPARHNR